jgi:hypothetical protein
MAEITESGKDVFTVAFDEQEAERVDNHSKQWGLSMTQAVADLLEYAMGNIDSDLGKTDILPLFQDDSCEESIRLDIHYPKTGPFAALLPADKQFLASVLAMSVREASVVILYKKMQKGT